MTISEQIREAALYALVPIGEMTNWQWSTCLAWKAFGEYFGDMQPDDFRTFMLLVAEALE